MGCWLMGNNTESIILKLSKENEIKIKEKAMQYNMTIEEYIKRICIYEPWIESYEE